MIRRLLLLALLSAPAWAQGPNGTSVLDSFTRADENPLSGGGNWDGPIRAGKDPILLVSNAASASVDSATNERYWAASTFGSDTECFFTASSEFASEGSANYGGCLLRLVNLEGTNVLDGYLLEYENLAGADPWYLFRIDNASFTQVGSTQNQEMSTGDTFSLVAEGTSCSMHYKASGGNWTAIATGYDCSAYTAAGNIGMLWSRVSTQATFDNFGGGTIGAAPAFPAATLNVPLSY